MRRDRLGSADLASALYDKKGMGLTASATIPVIS